MDVEGEGKTKDTGSEEGAGCLSMYLWSAEENRGQYLR
jgi:hypothetical protein